MATTVARPLFSLIRQMGEPGARPSVVAVAVVSSSFAPSTKSRSQNWAVFLRSSSFNRSKSWPMNCIHETILLTLSRGMMVLLFLASWWNKDLQGQRSQSRQGLCRLESRHVPRAAELSSR